MQMSISPTTAKHWKIGIVGCGWISGVHVEAIAMLPNASVVACCGRTMEKAQQFASQYAIATAFVDYQQFLAHPELEVVIVCTPNYLHHQMVLEALAARKHVIVEKPLAMNLEQCEDIVQAAKDSGLIVAYAEELCFVPKFVETKRIADSGSLGEIRFVKQIEKHDGPHSRWFYEPDLAGGGITIDMGCHSIEFTRWLLGKPEVTAVWSHMDTWLHCEGVHEDTTEEEDHAIIHLEFAGGATALLESSWTLKGGMESKAEVHGTGGVVYADLLQEGMGMRMYSDRDVPEDIGMRGWSFPNNAWNFQNGYPQEIAHFLHCMETGEQPLESAEDGLAVMEIMYACYYSAGTGRRIELPFRPRGIKYPMDLWKNPQQPLSF